MTGWTRKAGDLGKSATLSEGQVVSLLIGANGKTNAELLDAAYQSAKDIADLRAKAFSAVITTTVVAILAKFEIISGFTAGGVTVAEAAFKPIALVGYSMAGLYFVYFQTRYRFFEMWFENVFQTSAPPRRAELLLRYPLAFDVFKLEPSVRGYPAFVFPKGSDLWRLPAVMLLLIAIVIFALLAFALWISLSIDVWREAFPNKLVAALVVTGSLLTGLISGCLPLSGPKTRRYDHFGLPQLMSDFQARKPMRYAYWLQRIGMISADMGKAENAE